jgi:hypothetical protein
MGADLYINRLYKPLREKHQTAFDAALAKRNAASTEADRDAAQKQVTQAYDAMYADEVYFRDSYNGTSVLRTVGLSWWRDLQPDLDSDKDPDENNLSPAACLAFAARLREAGPPAPVTADQLRAQHCSVDDAQNSPEAWNEYFLKKYESLIAFFERAAQHGGMFASC